MATQIKNGHLVTAGSTSEIEYEINPIYSESSPPVVQLFIEVVSSAGGIQFSPEASDTNIITASHALWITGAKFPISVLAGPSGSWQKVAKIRAKATNSADTWRVTA